jgi:outer membrane protein assembly factor BamC
MLLVDEGFSRSWREVGLALDQVGFAVEDRDRSEGIYYVRYRDPLKEQKEKGFLSKLKFWGDDKPKQEDQYRIRLETGDDGTEVTVQDEEGALDGSSTAKRILTLLHEQLQ